MTTRERIALLIAPSLKRKLRYDPAIHDTPPPIRPDAVEPLPSRRRPVVRRGGSYTDW